MKLLILNCNSLINLTRRHELKSLIEEHKPHLVCLSETKLSSKHNFKLPNYQVFRTDSGRERSGGTAILIHDSVEYSNPKAIRNENFSATLVQIGNSAKSFLLISIYVKKVNAEELSQLFSKDNRVLVCGDFNARHWHWNCPTNNKNGVTLFEYCENNNTQIFFPLESTRDDAVLDIAVSKNFPISGIPHVIYEFCSDHLPVIFSIPDKFNISHQPEKARIYDIKNADWDYYRHIVHHKIYKLNEEPLLSIEQIDSRINTVVHIILEAFDRAVPLCEQNDKKLPSEITQLIKFRNFVRNKRRSAPLLFSSNLVNRLTRNIHIKIFNHFQYLFRKKLENIEPDRSNLFKKIRLLKSANKSIALEDSEGPIIDPNIIVEKVADYYESVFSGSNHVPDPTISNCVGNFFDSNLGNSNVSNLLTNFDEVKGIIFRLKNNKSPGIDRVSNRAIKNLPSSGIIQLVLIINAIIRFAYFPTEWKISKIISIPKPGKTLTPENTRPISLLCGFSKVAERVIFRRLWNSTKHLIPANQFGFVFRRSTTEAVMRLTNHLKKAKRFRKTTAVVLLDVQKAFDSVWHSGLIYKLINCNVNPTLIRIINSYLCQRKFFVCLNNTIRSSIKSIHAGVPQGSVLGPLLYILFTYDIPNSPNIQSKMQLYADDTILFCSSYSSFQCSVRIQSHLNTIADYFKRWNICINTAKTQLVYFVPHLKYSNKLNKSVPVYIEGQLVNIVDSIKYLGIRINKTLSFKDHVKDIRSKASLAFRVLFPFLCRDSVLDSHNKLLIYKLYIRPLITYAAPAWYELISIRDKKSIQIIQNKSLRFVFNDWGRPPDFRQTSNLELHSRANLLSIPEFNNKLTTNVINKLLSSSCEFLADIAHSY